MSSIIHGIYKGMEDAVITREEEEYFFAFLDRCGIAFSEVPASLRNIFRKGIAARDSAVS
ncbi:hypothetical protein KL86DPRO_10363 [uncultured delta proteobacterium]|uniref:Uncharacterized protein n=1 Tax=uncultured delta proteobacterium TaxID=34034 RepID=A0A212IYZ3_9DELT|nr:hypothetical protein KL86DPRO_10363 [uncultured delta proteobacterium]